MGDFMGDSAYKMALVPGKVLGAELDCSLLKNWNNLAEKNGTVFIGLAFLTVVLTDKLEFFVELFDKLIS